MTPITIDIPLRLSNPLNGSWGHWAVKSKLRKRQRQTSAMMVCVAMPMSRSKLVEALPVTVTITRIAPRKLDAWDGLGAACKGVIDGVADAFGVRDDHPGLTWVLRQERGAARQYGVRITIEPTMARAAPESAAAGLEASGTTTLTSGDLADEPGANGTAELVTGSVRHKSTTRPRGRVE